MSNVARQIPHFHSSGRSFCLAPEFRACGVGAWVAQASGSKFLFPAFPLTLIREAIPDKAMSRGDVQHAYLQSIQSIQSRAFSTKYSQQAGGCVVPRHQT